MRNQEISRQLQRLRILITRVDVAAGGNVEMQAHWARYLCVLAAGLLENALAEVYSEFAVGNSQQPVANFASHALAAIQNPKTSRFLEVAQRFKPEWRDELEAFVREDGRAEAIDSIMANRHLVAHGKNSSITLVRVKDYLAKAIQVVEFIEKQCAA
jgi:hypothetical protein